MPINKQYAIIIACTFIVGLLSCAISQRWLIIRMPGSAYYQQTSTGSAQRKTVTLHYWHHETWHSEDTSILWHTNRTAQTINYLVSAWLCLLDEEKAMDKKVTLQSVVISPTGTQAFLSFDRYPFNPQSSTHTKLMWLEGLLKTLRSNNVGIQSIRLLVHHTPLDDDHLDGSIAWPLTGFIEQQTKQPIKHTSSSRRRSGPFTIMLDPAGDAKHAGRTLDDSFERGVTLQFAQAIKQHIEHGLRNVRVVLTRFPGETVEPLQNANFANRLNVDLYLSFHFYQDEHERLPRLYVYQYAQDPTDLWPKTIDPLECIGYDQAHLSNASLTHQWGTRLVDELKKNNRAIQVAAWHTIPFVPLKGIIAPSLGIEARLHHKNDWNSYISPLVDAIAAAIC